MIRRMTLSAAGLIAIAVAASPVRSDVIFLKDGHAVHGRVRRETEAIRDDLTGQVFAIAKANNCYLIDDRVRYTVFGFKQVERADPDVNIRGGQIQFVLPPPSFHNKLPSAGKLHPPSPFNAKWERSLVADFDTGRNKIVQRLTVLTPYFTRVQSQIYDWEQNYLTSELGPEVVMGLLKTHPEIVGKAGEAPVFETQVKIFRFCMQAGWVQQARGELARLRLEFPGEATKLDEQEKGLRQLEVVRIWEALEQAAKVGQHVATRELLGRLPLAELPGGLQTEAANLRSRYVAWQQTLDQASRLLNASANRPGFTPDAVTARAIAAIRGELNEDTVERLEPFVTLAKQAEAARKADKPPATSHEQLLGLAISGWVLGATAAEADPTAAKKLWTLREKLLQHQRTHVAADRTGVRTAIAQEIGLSVPEVARVIASLPPAEPEALGEPPALERRTSTSASKYPPANYSLRLPPEYHPNRSYPLLLVLPNAEESTAQALAAWAPEAARRGFIAAAVNWGTIKSRYEYKDEELGAALAVLRDLRRFVQVDPDRVYLAGAGEGGNMAFDLGLSHPDLFAGVAPINGRPRWYSQSWYWRNAQGLPFYVVCGELTNDVRTWCSSIYEKWAERGYGSLMVQYRGRTNEFFPGEVPTILDWFERKRRSAGFPELGRNPNAGAGGEEYQTFRGTDNRFFWASTDSIGDKYTITDFVKTKTGTPAAVQATIRDNNQVTVVTRGMKQLTLWFGRSIDPRTGTRDMIDFAKPIKITVNGRQTFTNQNKPLEMKLETLLEDYYWRADRARLFFARVDFEKIP